MPIWQIGLLWNDVGIFAAIIILTVKLNRRYGTGKRNYFDQHGKHFSHH